MSRRIKPHEYAAVDPEGSGPDYRRNLSCKHCGWVEGRPWHIPPAGHLRTAEGLLVAEPDFHTHDVGRGAHTRVEKSLWFEGAWWWVCSTCGAIWQGVAGATRRYLRDLLRMDPGGGR